MNDQLASQLRQCLQIIGTGLTTLGITSAATSELWISIIMSAFGIVGMGASLYLSWRANTKESIAASFSQFSEVKKIETSDPDLAKIMKEADPNTEVKVATS